MPLFWSCFIPSLSARPQSPTSLPSLPTSSIQQVPRSHHWASSPPILRDSPHGAASSGDFSGPAHLCLPWLCPLGMSPWLSLRLRKLRTSETKLFSGPSGCFSCRERYSLCACFCHPHPRPCSCTSPSPLQPVQNHAPPSAGRLLPEARRCVSRSGEPAFAAALRAVFALSALGRCLSNPRHSWLSS